MRKSQVVGAIVAGMALAYGLGTPAHAVTGRAVVHDGPAGPVVMFGLGATSCAHPNAVAAGLTSGWGFSDVATGTHSFIDETGEAWIIPAPLGDGALRQSVGAGADLTAAAFVNPDFSGLPVAALLVAVNQVLYSHNLHASLGVAPSFVIFVDRDPMNPPTTDDQLVFQPAAQAPPCLAGAFDVWQQCDVLAGTVIPASTGVPTTVSAYITANPSTTFPAFPDPLLGVISGQNVAFTGFDAAVDAVALNSGIPGALNGLDRVEFDFEKDCSAYGGDADGDCLCDGNALPAVLLNQDTCLGDPNPAGVNSDADTICDFNDNCDMVANEDQADADGDSIGNACDTCTDTDGDGFGNPGFAANTCALDNCPNAANAGQEDADLDGFGDACDTPGLSLRRAQVAKSSKAGRDSWSAQAEIDTTLSPTFLADVDGGGLEIAIYDGDGAVVDTETFTAADCFPTSPNGKSLKCRNPNRSQVRFAKRPAPGFFKVVITVPKQSVTLPIAPADTPLGVTITSPTTSQTRGDTVNTCVTRSNKRTLCKETP